MIKNSSNQKSQQPVRDDTFMMSTRKGGGVLEICHVFEDSIVFNQ